MSTAAPPPGAARIHWWGTLLYVPLLYGLGWIASRPVGLLFPAWRADQIDLIGAVIALLLLLTTLPWRLRQAWGSTTPWRSLGLAVPLRDGLRAYLRGLLKAVLLLAGVSVALLLLGLAHWGPPPAWPLLLNALALLVGVGFAEELLFRGWLLGELSLLLGAQRGLWLQAGLFSLLHARLNLAATTLLPLLGGLLLLGLALGLQRRADDGALWGAVGLHGGLVGGWFVLQQGWLLISPGTPTWLLGAGGPNANPIGGLLGWLGLGLLLLARRRWWSQGSGI